ncbi:MAG: sigma-70 family RNA polymerase sigma factor [Caldithrix sp.]|nr:MAG: sigma-70 family RNA polymerase sigma factor [Caldithrix sp.]
MILSKLHSLLSFKLLLLRMKLDFAMEGKSQEETAQVSDSQLFAEIAAKKTWALATFYDRYSAHLFGLAVKILKDQQLAEDVLQDLFLYLWNHSDKFSRSRGNALSWVTIICRNRCIDQLRSKQRKAQSSGLINEEIVQNITIDESENPFEIVSYNEKQKLVSGALEQLPEEQRRPIEMAYFEGLSQTEISAERLQPLGTIKTRMRLGMQKLRNLMKQTME